MAEPKKDKEQPGPVVEPKPKGKPKVELLREFDARDPLVIMKKVNQVITTLGAAGIIEAVVPKEKKDIK